MAQIKNIGLKQARRLAQMSETQRTEMLADGFPLLLESAQSLWAAATKLKDHPRESEVLKGHAEEEAAKILILMDVVRCPPNLVASRIGPMMTWLYSHLARILYAKATDWKPIDLSDLRKYIDMERRAHIVDGPIGEYIFPNWTLYQRETQLYVDIAAFENGKLVWTEPSKMPLVIDSKPSVIKVAEALYAIGAFTPHGIEIIKKIWGAIEFNNTESHADAKRLSHASFKALDEKNLFKKEIQNSHFSLLFNNWQIPMYNLDFSIINVPIEDLLAERESNFWSQIL